MLEKHGLLESSIQHLNYRLCASNGKSAILFLIEGRRSVNDDVSVQKVHLKEGGNDNANLTSIIDKLGMSLLKAANISALQQEKDCSLAHESLITSRIDSLQDMKRDLNIHLASGDVSKDKAFHDVTAKEVEAIDEEINANLNKL